MFEIIQLFEFCDTNILIYLFNKPKNWHEDGLIGRDGLSAGFIKHHY